MNQINLHPSRAFLREKCSGSHTLEQTTLDVECFHVNYNNENDEKERFFEEVKKVLKASNQPVTLIPSEKNNRVLCEILSLISAIAERAAVFPKIHFNEFLHLKNIFPHWTNAHADCVIESATLKHVCVVKYSITHNVTEAFENWELLEWAAGVVAFSEYETIELCVVQPNCFTDTKIRAWFLPRKVFNSYLKRILEFETKTIENPYNYSTSGNCRKCEGRSICPQLEKETREIIQALKNTPGSL